MILEFVNISFYMSIEAEFSKKNTGKRIWTLQVKNLSAVISFTLRDLLPSTKYEASIQVVTSDGNLTQPNKEIGLKYFVRYMLELRLFLAVL